MSEEFPEGRCPHGRPEFDLCPDCTPELADLVRPVRRIPRKAKAVTQRPTLADLEHWTIGQLIDYLGERRILRPGTGISLRSIGTRAEPRFSVTLKTYAGDVTSHGRTPIGAIGNALTFESETDLETEH
jgi:hypothetical protein